MISAGANPLTTLKNLFALANSIINYSSLCVIIMKKNPRMMASKFVIKLTALTVYNFNFSHFDRFFIRSRIACSFMIKFRSLSSPLELSTLSDPVLISQSHASNSLAATGYFLTPKYLFLLTFASKLTHFYIKPNRPVTRNANIVKLKAKSWEVLNPEYCMKQGMPSHMMLYEYFTYFVWITRSGMKISAMKNE